LEEKTGKERIRSLSGFKTRRFAESSGRGRQGSFERRSGNGFFGRSGEITYDFVSFEHSTGKGGRLYNENYLMFDGTNAYLIAFIAEPAAFKKHKTDFDKIFDSFELMK
jgi:hypothetical protein